MHYEKDVPCPECKETVFKIIKQTLLPLSFRIVQENDDVLEMKNSGFLWTCGQNPLTGMSDITVEIKGHNLKLRANMGGFKKAIWYLILSLLFMVFFFVVLFSMIFGPSQKILRLCLGPFLPWPLLIPIIYFFMKSRTFRAVDIMLSNAIGKEI